MGEHGGTHLDAPLHFNVHGWTLDQIPPMNLIDVPAVLIDVEENVNELERSHEFVLDVKHIVTYEAAHGIIPSGSVVLIHFGWGKFWPNKIKYLGWENSTAKEETLNFPGNFVTSAYTLLLIIIFGFGTGLSADAAELLAKERQIIGVGLDTASVDPGINKVSSSEKK